MYWYDKPNRRYWISNMIESSKIHVTIEIFNNYIRRKKNLTKSWYKCPFILELDAKKNFWWDLKYWRIFVFEIRTVCIRMTHSKTSQSGCLFNRVSKTRIPEKWSPENWSSELVAKKIWPWRYLHQTKLVKTCFGVGFLR